MPTRLLWIALLPLVLGACAHGPLFAPMQTEVDARAWCRALYEDVEQRIQDAGLADGGAYRVPGYPYLRSDRLLAALGENLPEGWRQLAWMDRLARLDWDARQLELQRLHAAGGLDEPLQQLLPRLQRCSAALIETELQKPEQRAELQELAQVPDDYSTGARVLGLYPLALPFLRWGVAGYQDEVRARFEAPLPPASQMRHWLPPEAAPVSSEDIRDWIGTAAADPLGMPRIEPAQWQQLLAAHAPSFWIEQQSNADLPGAPVWSAEGIPGVDPARPTLYAYGSFTRFEGRVLPQLVYTLWFDRRAPEPGWDPYAGPLDGVVWRVTLGANGHPIAYDSIHSCGCYHLVFPALDRALRAPGFWEDPILAPQTAPAAPSLAVVLAAGTHQVLRVLPREQVPQGNAARLSMQPYRSLLNANAPPLFGTGGLVEGSQRSERFYLWPTGVRSPGAMRQAGRQATAFTGKRHFDDPDLLCEVYYCP